MRTKPKREIRIEFPKTGIPLEEALEQVAKIIAAGMIAEDRKKGT